MQLVGKFFVLIEFKVFFITTVFPNLLGSGSASGSEINQSGSTTLETFSAECEKGYYQ